jgi:surfactin synthase thioesterase subunit
LRATLKAGRSRERGPVDKPGRDERKKNAFFMKLKWLVQAYLMVSMNVSGHDR